MKWISVSKKLPRRFERVICLHEDGTICIEGMYPDRAFYYDKLYGSTTHWMPLPKPPRREGFS